MTSTPPDVRRLVVRPPNWLGDAVLALPALAAVRSAFPAAHLTVAGAPAVAMLFREVTDVRPDDIVELPGRHHAAAEALRRGAFDLGILFPNSFRSAWTLRRAGVPERWGFPTSGRGWVLTRRSPKPGRDRHRHHADYYRLLVRGLGLDCSDAAPSLSVSESSSRAAAALLRRAGLDEAESFVALAPGAAYGQAKQWPPARMAALAARLIRDIGCRCVMLGASHDRDAARAIESWLRAEASDTVSGLVDVVGQTSLGSLTGITAKSRVFVSNDSGAMHVAAALGRPVVALFVPTDERATGPLGDHDVLTASAFCRPCLLRDCPIDHRCMKRITVESVFDAVATRLAGETSQ